MNLMLWPRCIYINAGNNCPEEFRFPDDCIHAVGGGGIMIFGALIGQMIFKKIYADILVPEPVERDKVTFHALRHSFATHLLGKWVDIKYIKELPGHFDIKTTERYLHVAHEKLVVIQSPLDYLDTSI